MLEPGISPLPPPRPPKTLRAPGRRWWAALWAAGARWLDPAADELLLVRLCGLIDLAAAVDHQLAKQGRWYTTPQGQRLAHPAVADSRHLHAAITSLMSIAGFTPTDRARLGVAMQGETHDALALFRDRRSRAQAPATDGAAG
jgi:P27 family predicted phage terminase small subunit